MSRNYKFRDNEQIYFVSFAVVKWIDLFIRKEYKEIIIDSLRFCQSEKGLEIYAWCVMSSHIHLIIGSNHKPLSDIMRDFKSFTSRKLREAIQNHPQESRREWMLWIFEREGKHNNNNQDWQFWQQDNHPIELFDNVIMQQKLDYIHNNLIEAGFVDSPRDWLYSSARDYEGEKGLLDIWIIS